MPDNPYRKSVRAGLGLMASMHAEMSAAMALPCAPALGVHRPYCGCGSSKPAEKEEK